MGGRERDVRDMEVPGKGRQLVCPFPSPQDVLAAESAANHTAYRESAIHRDQKTCCHRTGLLSRRVLSVAFPTNPGYCVAVSNFLLAYTIGTLYP